MLENNSETHKEALVLSIDKGKARIVLLAVAITSAFFLIVGGYLFLDRGEEKPKMYAGPTTEVTDRGDTGAAGNQNQPPSDASTAKLEVVKATDKRVSETIEKVFKHIFLPSGDVQVATVENADEMRKINPLFYQFAKQGDIVLIYKDRAVLYDPVIDKVLDVAHF